MIQFTAAVWPDILAQSTAAGRATVLAGKFPSGGTIELLDAAASVIRTIDMGPWTVNGAYAVPGTYTDSALGGGTPVEAVFKAGATEIMRMTCGTLAGADYRLLANIVAGVPIRRGPFAVLFLPPPEPGTSQPSVVTAPTISGVAKVGQTLTATPGVYAGNPVPTVTRQWYSGATAIPGATGLFFTQTDNELGGIITFVEVPSNSVGSITVPSNALGPVVAADLNADAVPNPVNIDLSSSFDFAPYIVGGVPPYRVAVGAGYSLPSGASLPGTGTVLTVDGTVATGLTADFVFDIDDSAVAATLPTFGVLSSVGGADLPFTFGHVFKQGDVPSGSYVDSDLTDWQCVPTTTWPDGSLRHAIISGRATCTQNVRKDIALSVSVTDRSGTVLTETDLAAALPTVTIQGGSHTTTLSSLINTAALHRTVCTGPVMSNWIYRHPVTSSNHLVVWIDVRLYKGGRVEIFPWVENAYLTVANPTNDVRTWTVTIGGTQVFSQSINIKHHTRIPLISGSSFSYWTTDPAIVPVHDTDYMMASKMVPNYGWTTSETTLANGNTDCPITQTYTPNWIGNIPSGMAAAGYQPHIGVLPAWQAAYLSSGADARAYRATIANGLAAGSWSVHYRDSATHEPFLFSDYPSASIEWSSTPTIPAGAGGTNGTHDQAHQPSLAYLPWLISGRWFFLDEMLFWHGRNYLYMSPSSREYELGVVFQEEVRGRGWHLRTLAQILASYPTELDGAKSGDATMLAELKASWEANTSAYEGRYVTGTRDSGAWANNLGVLGLYSAMETSPYGTEGVHWWDAPWMQDTLILAFGHAWELNLPQSAGSLASHQAVRDHGYKHAVGLAGDGSATQFNWRHFASYKMPYTTQAGSYPVSSDWLADWGDVYAVYQVSGGGEWTALPNPDETEVGGSIYFESTPITSGSSWATGSALAFHYAALAMAKEHGATGADAAWARITGSSSWTWAGAAFEAVPVWSIYPRNA